MYKCELFYNIENAEQIKAAESDIAAALRQQGIELVSASPIAADPKKIAAAVSDSLRGSGEVFIFADMLDAADHSSFRKLFYELISTLEAHIRPESGAKKLTPKIKVSSLGDLGNGCRGYCFSLCGRRFIALPKADLTGKELCPLIGDAVTAADSVFEKQSEKYPEGVAFFDKNRAEIPAAVSAQSITAIAAPAQKQSFIRSFIPQKSDTKNQKVRKIIVLVAIAAFIGALIYVLDFFIFGPMQNNSITSEIQEIAYKNDSDADEANGSAQDWDALKEINDEIVGWITIPDTVIDYPVLEHIGDDRYNQYYIKRTYKKESSEYGSIFLDYRCTDSTNSKNVIMHGHDMNDGSMFAGLLKYSPKGDLKGVLEYYQEHPVIIFNTPDGDAKYKIISVYKTSTRYEHGEFFNYMQGDFNSDAEFMNFVYNTRIRSFFDIPVTVNEDDQLLTLSTCCYEFWEWRCVVVARKVRPGEDESVDTELASINSSPLFPDVYYQRYGGERPDPGTFKKAYEKGEVSWYDGKGNLEGSEDLTATLAANPTEPPTKKPKPGETKATEPQDIVYYQVTYRNMDGSQFAAYNVKEGDPLAVPEGKPVMQEDDVYTYEFLQWNLEIDGVDFDALNTGLEIYPIFKSIPK